MSVVINMPQMSANGLSENWLFKHCGDRHWQHLCAALGAPSAKLCDESGARLYPTFVAIQARYERPLSAVGENDCFDTDVTLSHFGRSFFHSQVTLAGAFALRLEMLTAFVSRETEERNDLRKGNPAATIAETCPGLPEPPAILSLSQRMRRAEIARYDFAGSTVDLHAETLNMACDYEPSPYVDYNGANLLYFAAYPTIADTLERQLIRDGRLVASFRDWSLATSTLSRDVYYYRNLDIGDRIECRLRSLTKRAGSIVLHTQLIRKSDGLPLADILTEKALLS